jgi:hypothetical protein
MILPIFYNSQSYICSIKHTTAKNQERDRETEKGNSMEDRPPKMAIHMKEIKGQNFQK